MPARWGAARRAAFGLRAVLCALTMLAAPAGGALAETAPVVLDSAAMRQVAFKALYEGDVRAALALADALLARDPNDVAALVVRSAALRDLGRGPEAQEAARRAWEAAATPGERYSAALANAQALSSFGRKTQAQIWLRRAAEVAPTPEARERAIRDFSYVRSRNPVVLQFDAAVAPSSNINNGSSATKIGIFTLDGAARALSGTEARLAFGATLRLPPTEVTMTELSASFETRAYRLSSKAREIAPDVRGSDYGFTQLEFGAEQKRRLGRAVATYGLRFGHNWYGGDDLSDYLGLDTALERPVARGTALQVGFSAERQWRRDGPGRDADILSLTGGIAHKLANDDILRASVTARRTLSDATWIDHKALAARLDWSKAAPVAGVRVGAGLGVEARDYAVSFFTADGRQDQRLSASLSLTFERLDYMGFSPTVDIAASRNRSNIAIYDSEDVGISFGFRSSF